MNLLRIVNEITLTGGVTYNINTGETNPDYGYMVSLPGREQQVQHVTEDSLREYINANSDELCKQERYLGVWKNGNYVLDVSIHVEDKEEALLLAHKYNQKAIWANKEKDEIWIG